MSFDEDKLTFFKNFAQNMTAFAVNSILLYRFMMCKARLGKDSLFFSSLDIRRRITGNKTEPEASARVWSTFPR